MSEESNEEEQPENKIKQARSTEELRNRAKDVLEKANQLLAESGKLEESEKPSEGDTKK